MWCIPQLFLAHFYRESNRLDDALAVLRPVLVDARQQGLPGLLAKEGAHVIPLLELAIERDLCPGFAAEVLSILQDNSRPVTLTIPGTGETLTPRETEVLRLLNAGSGNQAIASQLGVGVATVKTHVSRILSKMGVKSRTEAVAKARDFNLL